MSVVESSSITTGGVETPVLPAPVSALAGLHRVREPGDETHAYISLDRNERLQPLPGWFLEKIRQSLESALLTAYPVQDELYHQLAAQLGLPEEQFLLTAGSDAAVKALYQAYVRPGDTVVMLHPSYAMYEVYAQMFQARACKVLFNRLLKLDVEQLLASVGDGTRVVVLANPNQPTGTLLDEEVLVRLVQRTREVGALLAVDEAYYPFSRYTVMPWVKEVPHMLVIRSLSKAAGLAGLRIGFVAGHPEVVANLYKVRSAHDVNSMAILCASEMMKHPEIVNDYVVEVEKGGRLLTEQLRALGLVPLPTHTNFMLIRLAHRFPPSKLVETLRDRGYLVKGPFSNPCIEDCIRITLGPPALMAAFADVLEQILAEKVRSVS